MKNLGEYQHSYVHDDTLLLVDVFENSRNKCIEIYKLNPAHFFVCILISMAGMFKESKNKISIIT